MQGIYVHIPFCASKCGYCDFHSIVADGSYVGNYIKALQKEIEHYSTRFQKHTFDTLYLGGGTPTILTVAQLQEIISLILNNFNFSKKFEFSIEANPSTLNKDKLMKLAASGVNRISLGVQAFQNNLLRKLGRLHSVNDIINNTKQFLEVGITNFNLDLIYGLPEQTVSQWKDSLELAMELKPTHLSCYSLIIEEDTPFYNLLQKNQLNLPHEEEEYEMFQLTLDILGKSGYQHYEISNFAVKHSYQSQHNLIYWRNQAYLGLGSGAHGYINRQRYVNTLNLNHYINNWLNNIPAIEECDFISDDQAMDETMMLGLRLLEGVEIAKFEKLFGQTIANVYGDELKKLFDRGLLIDDEGWLKLTDSGVSLGNLVFSAFIR